MDHEICEVCGYVMDGDCVCVRSDPFDTSVESVDKFETLRNICCDLMGESEFDETTHTFSIDVGLMDHFERIVRALQ